MGRKAYRVNIFSVSSIENLKKELLDYKRQIPVKMQTFVERLADIGISVGQSNIGVLDDIGNVSSFVQFTKKVDKNKYGANALVIMSDIVPVQSSWWSTDGLKTVDVSPSLMYEYGSGFNSKDLNANKNPQGGQGTFPGQTHARDEGGWWWVDENGVRHESSGITPTTPMYKATMEMYQQVVSIAKEVFS